jgi:hypothetical protein
LRGGSPAPPSPARHGASRAAAVEPTTCFPRSAISDGPSNGADL